MTAQSYTFAISTDTATGKVSSTIEDEIRASAIETAFDFFSASGDVLDLWFKAALSGGDATLLDALVAAHAGAAPASPTLVRLDGTVDLEGRPVVSQSAYEFAEEEGGFDGYVYSCPAGTLSIFDEPVTKVLFVQGAICWWDTPSVGDYGEFSIVDKNDVLGLFGPLGLTVGVDVLELAKFVRKFRPPPWKEMLDLRQRTAGKVLPGLFMRFSYNNVGVDAVACGINYVDYSGD